MKIILSLLVCICLLFTPSKAPAFFGNPADTAYLAQILANTIKQLYELRKVVESGRDTLGLMRDINRGINDSLRVVESIGALLDPGLYKDLRRVRDIIRHLQEIYGIVVKSPDERIQRETDQVVAEAIKVNNSLYEYAEDLDRVGEQIKSFSHQVSPGGAAKLTAQSLGVMIHVMNQQLRATGTSLKISAQALAVQNKREKESTAQYLKEAQRIGSALKTSEPKFEFPRF